ncbi:MAG: sodium:proton antiporter [Gammaproteobacteria bacterium]|nr:sodium:proton antiporter [Gammaproteobacteria bacterium]
MQQNIAPAAEQPLIRRILSSIESFLHVETASGVVLLAAAAVALIWANSPWGHSYEALWRTALPLHAAPLPFGLGDLIGNRSLHFWINDGLMTIFFLVVGLEIRREMYEGALSDPRIATLPIVAAIAGVIVPALVYLLVNTDAVARRGWAVPTATDIAFAAGILSLAGKGIPPALRMLLLTLAIIDDIVAILVIAFFYSSGIAVAGLLIAACGAVAALAMQRLGIRRAVAYVLPGAFVWFGMLRAGIHPTLAGVVLGMIAPVTVASRGALSSMHPWVAYAIMPLFALANAGVSLQGLSLGGGLPHTIGAGIVLGLVLGKPTGIVLASVAAVRSGMCALPEGIKWRHLGLLGCLGGIGFTMSIFISNLAFSDPVLLATSKVAVLVASTVAATAGLIVGRFVPGMRVPPQ